MDCWHSQAIKAAAFGPMILATQMVKRNRWILGVEGNAFGNHQKDNPYKPLMELAAFFSRSLADAKADVMLVVELDEALCTVDDSGSGGGVVLSAMSC